MKITHEHCMKIAVKLPTDYAPWGEVRRWQGEGNGCDPDCSSSCRYWWQHGGDWGTCTSPESPRRGLLTFEHQAGRYCWLWSRAACVWRGPTEAEIRREMEKIELRGRSGDE